MNRMKLRKQTKPDPEPSPPQRRLRGQTVVTSRQPTRARVSAFLRPVGAGHRKLKKPRVGARVTKYENRCTGGEKTQMLSEHQNKNANFLRILMTLRALRQSGDITEKEYRKAKKYYQNLTGADIVLTD